MRSARNPRIAKLTPGNPARIAAQIVLDGLRVLARQRHQVDLELGVMRAPGVLGQLGPPDPLSDGAHARIAQQRLGYPRAEAERLVERGAGHGGHVDEIVALPKLRQEGGRRRTGSVATRADAAPAPPRRRPGAGDRSGASSSRRVTRLEPARARGDSCARCSARPSSEQGQRGRDREGDDERGEDGEDVGEARAAGTARPATPVSVSTGTKTSATTKVA